MPMVVNSGRSQVSTTATYIYQSSNGALLAWGPDSANLVVASSGQMTAAGLGFVSGLPPLDIIHSWDPATKTVLTGTNPTSLTGGQFIFLFTPAEAVAIKNSVDPAVVQYMLALQTSPTISLSDPIIVGGVNYLESINLIGAGRAAQVLANQPHA